MAIGGGWLAALGWAYADLAAVAMVGAVIVVTAAWHFRGAKLWQM